MLELTRSVYCFLTASVVEFLSCARGCASRGTANPPNLQHPCSIEWRPFRAIATMRAGKFCHPLAPIPRRLPAPKGARLRQRAPEAADVGAALFRKFAMSLATDQDIGERGLSPKAKQFIFLRDEVMDHWEREVRERVSGARHLLGPVLTNTLPAFYDNIAEALSPAHPREDAARDNNASTAHGSERARVTPFGPDQVVHEYHLFREAIAEVTEGRVGLDESDWKIIDRSINQATREAVRAFAAIQDELRRKLAAALSHDMRTPLSVIANGAQLVGISPDIETARRAASKIESNAIRLGDMMGELLDALTHQGGEKLPLHVTRFDVLDLIDEMREQYCQNQVGLGGIEFAAVGHSVFGHWCRGSLRRALENLINNAIKYGDDRGVRVMAREARGRLMLSVHNEGNPIPENQHNRIFEYLSREGAKESRPGWGIGLQFVKGMAESHGGSVSVDSSHETGTTFLIDVPVDCRPFAGCAEAAP